MKKQKRISRKSLPKGWRVPDVGGGAIGGSSESSEDEPEDVVVEDDDDGPKQVSDDEGKGA